MGSKVNANQSWMRVSNSRWIDRQTLTIGGNKMPIGQECNFADKNANSILKGLHPEFDWADVELNDGYGTTAPVGCFKPNVFGLQGMAVNVREWCTDWHSENYFTNQEPKRAKSWFKKNIPQRILVWYCNQATCSKLLYRKFSNGQERWVKLYLWPLV